MIINHNISAMNAHRQLSINNSTLAKSLEKLSSGLAINRASDNAAGLAISEKMRGQISGLNQATTNAQDGISLIQTAEGALNETHSILQRMRELAVQSANGTYQDDVDRENIQKEVEALKSEVDRIATSTHYNNIKLLDGSLGGVKSGTSAGPAAGTVVAATDLKGAYFTSNVAGTTLHLDTASATKIGTETAVWNAAGTDLTLNLVANHTYTQADIDSLIANATQTNGATMSAPATVSIGLEGGSFKTGAATASTLAATTTSGVKASVGATLTDRTGANVTAILTSNKYGFDATKFTIKFDAAAGEEKAAVTTEQVLAYTAAGVASATTAGAVTINLQAGKDYTASELNSILQKAGLDYSISFTDSNKTIGANSTTATLAIDLGDDTADNYVAGSGVGSTDPDDSTASGKGLTFQIGANGSEDQRVSLAVKSQSTVGLGIAAIDCSTQDGANKAIATIDAAINTVSGTRADLGALQNRLEHTINSLGVASENLTAAESRIRDVDMAKEMMSFTKTQILSQAAQAMLAQANTLPQGVLQLLR